MKKLKRGVLGIGAALLSLQLWGGQTAYFLAGTIQGQFAFNLKTGDTNQPSRLPVYSFRVEVYGGKWRMTLGPQRSEVSAGEGWTDFAFDGKELYILRADPSQDSWSASVTKKAWIIGNPTAVPAALWCALLPQTLPGSGPQKIPNLFAHGEGMLEVEIEPAEPGDQGPPKRAFFRGSTTNLYRTTQVRLIAEPRLRLDSQLTVPKQFRLELYSGRNLRENPSHPRPFCVYTGTVTNSGALHHPFPGPPKLPEAGPIRLLDCRFDPNSPIMLWILDHWPSEAEVRRTPEYRRWAALTGQGVPSKWGRVIGLLWFLVLLEGFFFLVWYMRKVQRSGRNEGNGK